MRKHHSEKIGNVLQQFLRQSGLETPLNQHRLIAAWPAVMGQSIAQITTQLFIQNQTLHVQLRSPVIRQEILMRRKYFVQRLNEYVGAQVIADIIIH